MFLNSFFKKIAGLFSCLIIFCIFLPLSLSAEVKMQSSLDAPGREIPKLPVTPDDPKLFNGHVYPAWGPVCQRYTYSVVYQDEKARPPEYVKIYFNGKMIDMQKENAEENDYKKGVKYIYQFVPQKLGSNFYYFEASNGLGKARDSIIDSPDNGPVLFETAFDKNEIAVIDPQTQEKILSFPLEKEWVGGIALSANGQYLAAKTSNHIYFFNLDKSKKEPAWVFQYNKNEGMAGGDVKGGIDLSEDGSKIAASIGQSVILFDQSSNQPVWRYDQAGNAYNIAISQDGQYLAAATAGEEENTNTNLLILWNQKSSQPLWQYHSSGNFHDVSLSKDGNFIVGATGCPDRRFYLFSKDSNQPLIKSEMLTRDSPVHRAKISSDGLWAAVGSESDAGAVFLFSKSSDQPLWKFPTPNGSSIRALNFTPDGEFIGAADFQGDAYIFSREKNTPLAQWKVNASLGALDIADDASFIAAGGIDKKVHIFSLGSKEDKAVELGEYITEIDISANGKYIAAGTGGSVYFFESFSKNQDQIFTCSEIIEPQAEASSPKDGGNMQTSFCGDNVCEGPENLENCAQDCDLNYQSSIKNDKQNNLPIFSLFFPLGFALSLLGLGAYLAFHFLHKNPKVESKLNQKILLILSSLTFLFLVLSLIFIFFNKPKNDSTINCNSQSCEQDLRK